MKALILTYRTKTGRDITTKRFGLTPKQAIEQQAEFLLDPFVFACELEENDTVLTPWKDAPAAPPRLKKGTSMLIEQLKTDIKSAMRENNKIKKDVLRVIVGDIQTLEASASRKGKPITDEDVLQRMRKLVEDNKENLSRVPSGVNTVQWTEENKILEQYLPTVFDYEQTEAELLNSDGPEIEQMEAAKSEGAAMGVAMKFFKEKQMTVDAAIVRQVVQKVRELKH